MKALIPDYGIVERFHKTVLDEFYRLAFRKKIYGSISDLHESSWSRRGGGRNWLA